MKITITKFIKTQETIEVELPYYFKRNLDLDFDNKTIHGKIEKDKTTYIAIQTFRTAYAEIEVRGASCQEFSCYLKDEYKSTKEEYEEAKGIALSLIQNA